MVVQSQSLDRLSAVQLRELTVRLTAEVKHKQALIDKLTHENALLKRMKFAVQSERFDVEQFSLLDDAAAEYVQSDADTPVAQTIAHSCWRRPKTEPLLRVVPTQN
jgi:transposase